MKYTNQAFAAAIFGGIDADAPAHSAQPVFLQWHHLMCTPSIRYYMYLAANRQAVYVNLLHLYDSCHRRNTMHK